MSSGVHSHSTQLIKPKQVLQKKMLISLCSTLYIYIMYIYIYIHITLKVSSLESSSLMSFFPVHLRFSTFSSTPSTHHPGPQPQNKTQNTFSPTSGPLHLHLLRLLSCLDPVAISSIVLKQKLPSEPLFGKVNVPKLTRSPGV